MKIVVIGKAHMEGMSKRTGKDYNFNQIHYNAPARGVEGLGAMTLMLDPDQVSYASIEVGATYSVEFDQRGYVVAFDLVSAPVGGHVPPTPGEQPTPKR